jgi:hypothetical protein
VPLTVKKINKYSLASESLNSLQWDSVLASALRLRLIFIPYRCTSLGDGIVGDVISVFGLSVLVGPGSAALLILGRRDELVFEAVSESLYSCDLPGGDLNGEASLDMVGTCTISRCRMSINCV